MEKTTMKTDKLSIWLVVRPFVHLAFLAGLGWVVWNLLGLVW